MKSIQNLTNKDLKKLYSKKSFFGDQLKPKQWIAGPIHGFDNNTITAWCIFQLDPDGMEGDIIPIGGSMNFFDSCEIVRAHNITLGYYEGE